MKVFRTNSDIDDLADDLREMIEDFMRSAESGSIGAVAIVGPEPPIGAIAIPRGCSNEDEKLIALFLAAMKRAVN